MAAGDRKAALALFVLSFAALQGLGRQTWGTIDAVERLAVTRSLLTSGSVVTPQFGAVKYGPLPSVLMLPTYALGYGIGRLTGSADPDHAGYRVTAVLFTPLLASLLVALFYGFARRLGHAPATAALGAWSLLWCTLVLPYSRLLFSELLSATLLLAAAACLLRPPENSRSGTGFLFLAAAALNYAIYLPLLAVAAVAVPWRTRRLRSALAGGVTLAATLACWALYNRARYGSIWQFGYAGEAFTTPLLRGLYGLLASPGRGLVFYSLPTAVALFLAARAAARGRLVPAVSVAAFLFYLVLYARWGAFEGGWCWGPRFLLPFVPLLHLALLPFLSRPVVRGALAFGVLVNAWEYASEWRVWEKATFDSGAVDYLRSVFELRYVAALHGYAGATTLERLAQFATVAAAASVLLGFALRARPGGRLPGTAGSP